MTREEQILNEAKKYYYDDINCHNAFLHGVEWADEHPADVWHDVSEMPEKDKPILVEVVNTLTPKDKIGYYVAEDWTIGLMRTEGFQCRWAYISDLLPKQFGNSKQVKGGEQ